MLQSDYVPIQLVVSLYNILRINMCIGIGTFHKRAKRYSESSGSIIFENCKKEGRKPIVNKEH